MKKKYKKIPAIENTSYGFRVLSGTRYPCDLRRNKFKNSAV